MRLDPKIPLPEIVRPRILRPKVMGHTALAAPLLLCLGCSQFSDATIPLEQSEREIAESEVPAAALAALRELARGRVLARFEREDRGAFVAYEGEWLDGDIASEATLLADGSLLETARALTPAEMDDLPDAVRARIEALRAEGRVIQVSRRSFVFYDIDAMEGDARREYLVRPDGVDAAVAR